MKSKHKIACLAITILLVLIASLAYAVVIYHLPYATIIPKGMKVHFGNYWISTSGTNVRLTAWFKNGWTNYTVYGAGTQQIYNGSKPTSIYIDGIKKDENDGWSYSDGITTITGATVSASLYWGWVPPGYNLNLRVKDWDLTDAISGALVYKDSDVKTSDANGWANWTLVSGTVQIKVRYFGFWVNGTFSVTMDSDKTINVQCKLYDVTVLVQEGVQNAYLAGANVTVYNSTSVQGNKITSGLTGNNGQVQLLNLPNNTLTFTQYGGTSYSLVIGNTTRLVSSENQTFTLTANQNNISTNSYYSIIAFIGVVVPLKGGFARGRLKKKRRNKHADSGPIAFIKFHIKTLL